MAFDFPSSPTVGQTYAPAPGILYTWNGYAWASQVSSTGMMTKIVPILASGTYTPSAGLISAIFEAVGGGGGGAGVLDTTNASVCFGGGGGGGYSRTAISAAAIGASQVVTVGAGGTAGNTSGTNGGNGGVTSVGTLCVANGGGGAPGYTTGTYAGGAGAVTAGAVGDVTAAGSPGGPGSANPVGGVAQGGHGGASYFGGGGRCPGWVSGGSTAGAPGTNYGSGGSSASGNNTAGTKAGGVGAPGAVFVTESIAVPLTTSSIATVSKIVPITASTTYVPSAGLVSAIVECVGGGGAGGGITVSTGTLVLYGGGGGSGGYSRKALTAAQIGASQSITIGAGGTGVVSGDGNNGGDTFFGSLCRANGGGGGGRIDTAGTYLATAPGGTPGVGDIASGGAPGGPGGYNRNDIYIVPGGMGGSSVFGGGGAGRVQNSGAFTGTPASGYGGGGGGAQGYNTAGGTAAGGAGSAGIVIITEFIAVTATAAPGFPVLIQRQDVSSAVATVDFTSGIDATYDEYEIHFWNVRFVTTNQNLLMQVSQNNGSTWVAAASSYSWQSTFVSTSLQTGSASTADTKINVYSQSGFPTTATNNSQMGTIKFTGPSASGLLKQFMIDVAGTTEGNSPTRHIGSGTFLNTGIFNGVRLFSGVGNIGSGSFVLYGIKK